MKKQKWILIRDNEVRNVFNDRKEAVKHFKELLKQTLKDFESQDKNNMYDYSIIIPKIEIKPIKERGSEFSLI